MATEPELIPFDEWLREWKGRTGVTIDEAATLFIVSTATFKRYLNGSSVPHPWLQDMFRAAATAHEKKVAVLVAPAE